MEDGKYSADSMVEIIHRPLPEEANHDGNVYGGNILRHMDGVGAIAALRHARGPVLTAAVEYMSFRSPVKVSEFMIFKASVNAVWNSSMEVGIRTEAEHPYTGERRHACTCYLTFVHVDEQGKPTRLPRLIPSDTEAKRRMEDANRRTAFSRLEHRGKGPRLRNMLFSVVPGSFSICKLEKDAAFPDLAGLPATAFLSCTRTRDELCLVLSDEGARLLEKKHPGLNMHRGMACIKLEENNVLPVAGILSSISTVLAAAKIPLLTISTYESCYILMDSALLPDAMEKLEHAGNRILEPGS